MTNSRICNSTTKLFSAKHIYNIFLLFLVHFRISFIIWGQAHFATWLSSLFGLYTTKATSYLYTNIYILTDCNDRNQNYSNCYGIYMKHELDKLTFANISSACVISCESCFWLVNTTKQLKNYGIFKGEQTLHTFQRTLGIAICYARWC